MKLKTRIKLLIVLLAVFAAALIAGCNVGEKSLQDILDENGMTARVTYYANGGTFNGTGNVVTRNLYYRPDSPVINIGEAGTTGASYDISKTYVSRANYVLVGWFYAELDEGGNPKFENDEKTIVKSSGRQVDFSTLRIKDGEKLFLCAEWAEDVRINYILVCEESVLGKDGVVYNPGDIINSTNFGSNGKVTLTDSSPRECDGATFLQYFSDEACKNVLTGTIEKPAGDNPPDTVIYAKYIKGNWNVVRTSSQVKEMFTATTAENYYVLNDIDCSAVNAILLKTGEYGVIIEGNGHTLSNLSFIRESVPAGGSYAIFGTFGATANIKNLTLKNITAEVKIRGSGVNLYLVCKGAEEGASFENFKIDGAEMTITGPSDAVINNIQLVDDVYQSGNWLYGGAESDEAFSAAHSGISVINGKLTVNGTIVTGE